MRPLLAIMIKTFKLSDEQKQLLMQTLEKVGRNLNE